jgi:hypothetical protein
MPIRPYKDLYPEARSSSSNNHVRPFNISQKDEPETSFR